MRIWPGSFWVFAVCIVGCADKTQDTHESAGSENAGGAGGEGGASGDGGAKGEGGANGESGAGGRSDATRALDASGAPAVVTFASLQELPSNIATDGHDVYWLNIGQQHPNGTKDPPDNTGGQVVACPVEGCSGAPTVLVSGLSTDLTVLAAGGGNLAWADDMADDQLIESCVAGNCAASRLAVTSGRPYDMVVDAKDVYWVDGGPTVKACSIAGCSTPRTFGEDSSSVVLSGGLALDDDNLYWSKTAFSIVSCPKAGCTGAPRVVLANLLADFPDSLGSTAARPLVVAGDSLYFATMVQGSAGLDGKLFRCAKTGCDAPTVLAAALTDPSGLGTDGTTLYFSEHSLRCCTPQDTTCCNGRYVQRLSICAATGCNGMPTVLLPDMNVTSNIAADPHHVFWATSDGSDTTDSVDMLAR